VLTRLDLRGQGGDLTGRLPRPGQAGDAPLEAVRRILADVRARGDAALREYTERFDKVAVDALRVPPEEVAGALDALPVPLREALEAAREAIETYHRSQVRADATHADNGVVVRDLRRPVARAGVYVPGGRARYPSTVLMTAIPARVAGVPEVVLCVPPGADGL
jgi:histidinol dehydrogenase